MKSMDPSAAGKGRGLRLTETDRFSFRCHAGLDCFNRCCRNLNLFLYPYDVTRLKAALGMTSAEFIDRHVDVVLRDGNAFPDVLLRMSDAPELPCPFLGEAGCTVYRDRPDTCRHFPVEHGLQFRDAGPPEPVYFFRPPDFCRGRHEAVSWTVEQWKSDQEAARHQEMTRRWSEVKRLFDRDPWQGEGPDGPRGRMAFMAAYNVDAFRGFVFDSSFLKRFRVPPKRLEAARRSDPDLMLIGFDWIRLFVFGIRTDTIRPR